MKITFILPDLRAGGAEKVCINLATEWIAKGHSITFVLMNKQGEYLENIPKKIKIISLDKKKLREIFFPLIYFFYKHKPDVTLAQMWPLTSISVIAWLFSLKKGKLFLVDHVHLSSSVAKEIFFPELIFKWILKLCIGIRLAPSYRDSCRPEIRLAPSHRDGRRSRQLS